MSDCPAVTVMLFSSTLSLSNVPATSVISGVSDSPSTLSLARSRPMDPSKSHFFAISCEDLERESMTSALANSSLSWEAILSMRALRKRESRGVPG